MVVEYNADMVEAVAVEQVHVIQIKVIMTQFEKDLVVEEVLDTLLVLGVLGVVLELIMETMQQIM